MQEPFSKEGDLCRECSCWWDPVTHQQLHSNTEVNSFVITHPTKHQAVSSTRYFFSLIRDPALKKSVLMLTEATYLVCLRHNPWNQQRVKRKSSFGIMVSKVSMYAWPELHTIWLKINQKKFRCYRKPDRSFSNNRNWNYCMIQPSHL